VRSSVLTSWITPVVIVIVGFAGVVPLSGAIERLRPTIPAGYEDSDLLVEGSRLKGFALGMEGLIADWYWMRSLQYIGNKVLDQKSETINFDDLSNLNPRLLYPYLDNATDLDPHFMAAYTYGALVLPAIDADKAIQIIEKGIRNNPGEWRLYQHLGFVYWKLKNYRKAAETYERGSQIPGAAPFLKLMAASMQTNGGDRETARQIFKQMLDETDWTVRITAERRLRQIQWLDEQDAIDKALAEAKERTGRCPTNLIEIRPALARAVLPDGNEFHMDEQGRTFVDPSGVPYLLNVEQCRVQLDRARTEIPTQ